MGYQHPNALEIVRTRSLASLVADEVERMILTGEMPAGERLNEMALAARLRVSRGPVREAIRGLERAGLLVTIVNQGSYVRTVSEAEAIDIYGVRAALAGQACAQLAGRITRPDLASLRALVRRMAAARRDDAAEYYACNRAFHSALLGAAGNARAARIDETLGNELNLFRMRALVAPDRMRASNAEHAAMLRAIAAGDAAAARGAGEAHIAGGMRRFLATRPGVQQTRPEDRRSKDVNGKERRHGTHTADDPAGDGRRARGGRG